MSDHNGSLVFSPKDSARFDLDIYRATLSDSDEKAVFADILSNRADVAILRCPAGTAARLQRLRRFGLEPIQADTLVYYSQNLDRYQPHPVRESGIEEATPTDSAAIAKLVSQIFADYRSHYHSNSLFSPPAILAGYAEWAQDHLTGSNRQTWVVRQDEEIIAFACCQFDQEQGSCEGVLYGVHPEHAGRGLYGDLIRHTQTAFKARGFKLMKVSTQIGNFAVQKVWSREGFILTQAYDTFHVNALLSERSNSEVWPVRFTAEQVAAFARISGDTNPIHLDDAAAQTAGFTSRISHGVLVAAELSRIFGTRTPGPGTLFLGMRLAFLAPIYQEMDHTLTIRFLDNPGKAGFNIAAASVRDPAGRLCVLAYNDLLHRYAA